MTRTLSLLPLLPLLPLLSLGCVLSKHPTELAQLPPATAGEDLLALLASPGPLHHEAAISARWAVPLGGLVDLDDPAAAELMDEKTPIVLPVHLLTHPSAGVFVVDTGVDRDLAAGGHGPVKGLVRSFTKDVVPVESLGAMIERQDAPLGGVLITHMHLDHIMGLPDVPAGTPIFVGQGETEARALTNGLLRRTFNAALDGQAPLRTWDPAEAQPLGPVDAAWDVLGDGSLWALSTPGHTPGSTSYLARTTEGPVLFTGDTCHTLWGWEHGVTPGSYTADHEANAASLGELQALAEALPDLRVYVGHELDGEGTGVGAVAEAVAEAGH